VGVLWAVVLSAAPLAGFVPVLEKVRPAAPFHVEGEATVHALRGECEGLQLRLRQEAAPASLSRTVLEGAGTSIEVRWMAQRFVRARRPSNPDGAVGEWPDPLVPVGDAPVPPLLYGEICVPADQPPGTYLADVEVALRGGQQVRLPLRLEVLRPRLPATSTRPNTFGISLYSLARGHGLAPESEEARRLLSAYARSALAHRVSLHGMGIDPLPSRVVRGRLEVDFRAYDRELGPFLDGTALPSGARFSTAEVRDDPRLPPPERAQLYAAIEAHFRARGWPQLLFFYAKDEPTPGDFPHVHAQARAVHARSRIPVLVTSPHDARLRGAADILAPVLNCFFPRPGPATCPRPFSAPVLRQVSGAKRVFWYQSCMSHGCGDAPLEGPTASAFTGWASYMVDHPAALNRAMGPLAFLAGVDGELYFATVYAYDTGDPWEDTWAFGGNGDGTLFYPGTPARLGGAPHRPVESLRLKHLRDGLEDDEALQLLARLGGQAEARALVRQVVRSGFEVERSAEAWERFHVALRRALDARWKGRE
jgi:hypothetical protein